MASFKSLFGSKNKDNKIHPGQLDNSSGNANDSQARSLISKKDHNLNQQDQLDSNSEGLTPLKASSTSNPSSPNVVHIKGHKRDKAVDLEQDEVTQSNGDSNNHRKSSNEENEVVKDSEREKLQTTNRILDRLKQSEKNKTGLEKERKGSSDQKDENSKESNEDSEDEQEGDENDVVSFANIRRTLGKGGTVVDNQDQEYEIQRGKTAPLNFESASSESDVDDSLVEDDPYQENARLSNMEKKRQSFRRQQTKLRDDERYKVQGCIIFPDDKFRKRWDIMLTIALLYTALLMPVRIAFVADDVLFWVIADWMIDSLFFIDVFINFFSAYFDNDDNLVVDRKKIAWHYAMGWFTIDVVSIFPFHLLNQESDSTRYNNLVRVARLPRLYRLIKIIKLVRMLKIIRDKNKFKNYMNDFLKLNPAIERLLISVIAILVFCHISACLWYMLVSIGESDRAWLANNGFEYLSGFDQYMASFYMIVQTVVTVGYGDISPLTVEERLLACIWMIIGVLFYSVFIGFLSSLISDMESQNQRYSQKLHMLSKLKREYGLSISFTKKLKNAIKYENKQILDSKHFLNELPANLAIELAFLMHKDIVDGIPFLQNRPKSFIAFLGPLLKPIKINKNEHIFMEGDPADEVFFIKEGKVAYILQKYKNFPFLKIRSGYFFGEVDLLFYGEIRKYTAVAVKDCELYVLNKKDFKKVFLVEFREIFDELLQNAYARKLRTRKIYKEAINYCKDQNEGNEGIAKLKKLHRDTTNLVDIDELSDSDESGEGNMLPGIKEEDEDENDHGQGGFTEAIGTPISLAKTPKVDPGKQGMANLKAALAFNKSFGKKSADTASQEDAPSVSNPFGSDNKIGDRVDNLEDKLSKLVGMTHSLKAKMGEMGSQAGSENQSNANTPKSQSFRPKTLSFNKAKDANEAHSPLDFTGAMNKNRANSGVVKKNNLLNLDTNSNEASPGLPKERSKLSGQNKISDFTVSSQPKKEDEDDEADEFFKQHEAENKTLGAEGNLHHDNEDEDDDDDTHIPKKVNQQVENNVDSSSSESDDTHPEKMSSNARGEQNE